MPRPFTLFVIVMLLAIAALAALMVQRSGGWAALSSGDKVSSSAVFAASDRAQQASARSVEQQTGSRFTPAAADPWASPAVELLSFDGFDGANAIWGASGRDDSGNIWLGVSSRHGSGSAHLYQLPPGVSTPLDRGAVETQLRQQGIGPAQARQGKIHSRIVQADDGYLYFTSMDEHGEREDGSAPPQWGSHLWRVKPPEYRWEHLMSAPEGLIAVSGVGRWIYALGYWGHKLYQYDTESGDVRSVTVGSVGGHISRNLLSDRAGHVYVPRLRTATTPADDTAWMPYRAGDAMIASLVEYDSDLNIVNETPLPDYIPSQGDPAGNHGIIGLAWLRNGDMVFTTHSGYLYRIYPRRGKPAWVVSLGSFLPNGGGYTASLFSIDGERWLAGVSRSRPWQWVVRDLNSGQTQNTALALPKVWNLQLYGSVTRDDAGNFYLVGQGSLPAADRKQGRAALVARLKPAAEGSGATVDDPLLQ